MNRPKIQKEVAVIIFIEMTREIHIHSSQDALADFEGFGHITNSHYGPNSHCVHVDSRYLFSEVLEYIEGYE